MRSDVSMLLHGRVRHVVMVACAYTQIHKRKEINSCNIKMSCLDFSLVDFATGKALRKHLSEHA